MLAVVVGKAHAVARAHDRASKLIVSCHIPSHHITSVMVYCIVQFVQ